MTGTANLLDPGASPRIVAELAAYAEAAKIDNITALTGPLEV
jgi:hypothetical protein